MLLLQRERWTKRRRRRYRRRHRRRRRRPLVSIAPTSTAADFRSFATKVISQKKRFSETLNRNQLRSRVRRNLTGGQKSEYEQKIEFPTTRPILGQNLVSQHERQMPHAA